VSEGGGGDFAGAQAALANLKRAQEEFDRRMEELAKRRGEREEEIAKKREEHLDKEGEVAKELGKDKVKKALKNAVDMFKSIATGDVGGALASAGEFLASLVPLQPVFDAFGQAIGVLTGIMGAEMMPVVKEIMEVMLSDEMIAAYRELGKAFAEMFKALLPILPVLVDLLVPLLRDVLVPVLKLLVLPLRMVSFLFQALAPLLQILIIPLRVFGALVEWVVPFVNMFGRALDVLAERYLKPAIKWAKWLAEVAMYPFRVIAWGIRWLIDQADILNVTGVTAGEPPAVPAWPFAKGGIVMAPTLGLLAERAPEAVVPLDKLGELTGGADLLDRLDRLVELQELEYQRRRRKDIWQL